MRVNDTRAGDGTAQYLPKLAVAPDGRLDVLYYDRRADRTNVLNEVSLQSSFDDGKTFRRASSSPTAPFSSRIGFGAERGPAGPRQPPRRCCRPTTRALRRLDRHARRQRADGQAGPRARRRRRSTTRRGCRARPRLPALRRDRAHPPRRRYGRARARPAAGQPPARPLHDVTPEPAVLIRPRASRGRPVAAAAGRAVVSAAPPASPARSGPPASRVSEDRAPPSAPT